MGNLFLILESFETSNIPQNLRDRIFINFCDAVKFIKAYPDNLFGSADLYIHNFSYGNFYKLLFGAWPDIKNIPSLKGLSSTAVSYFHQIMFDKPGLFKLIDSKNDFDVQFSESNYGYSGFDGDGYPSPYIKCRDSWINWKCDWLKENQGEILWDKANDNFLPNKDFSNEILKEEVIKHGAHHKLSQNNNSFSVTFYEEVLKKKAPHEKEAYIKNVGCRIVKMNYYKFEIGLTRKERNSAGGSLRAIFSLIGKNGTTQYISIDHKHGMFEYYDCRGIHQGEFRFDGTPNKPANSTHNLKSL